MSCVVVHFWLCPFFQDHRYAYMSPFYHTCPFRSGMRRPTSRHLHSDNRVSSAIAKVCALGFVHRKKNIAPAAVKKSNSRLDKYELAGHRRPLSDVSYREECNACDHTAILLLGKFVQCIARVSFGLRRSANSSAANLTFGRQRI